jgi:glycosyltransferase involved in cell wall biosynthesis
MKILCIAPLPPPMTGHSLASQAFVEDLSSYYTIEAVDLSTSHSMVGADRMNRYGEVLRIVRNVWRKRNWPDTIYFTISESLGGNIKDLLIYGICRKKLPGMFVHLHGGSLKRLLFDHHPWLRALNKRFLARVAGVIITGHSHAKVFAGMVEPEQIHVVPNFAEDELFADKDEIKNKFTADGPLRVLYLSGLERKKGYFELARANFLLSPELRAGIRIDFAGQFDDTKANRESFLANINAAQNMTYHGVVHGEKKKALLRQAHVFCLPTMHFEGQPISILEAYASGCVVLTSCPPGILDIFADGVNGFEIEKVSPDSIAASLHKIMKRRGDLFTIARHNRRIAAEKYRRTTFCARMRGIIEAEMVLSRGI